MPTEIAKGSIASIANWFNRAKPEVIRKDWQVQVGVHFEEVSEMVESLKGTDRMTQSLLTQALIANHALALHLKTSKKETIETVSDIDFLDACCDQIVTATGSAEFLGMHIGAAVAHVDESNWSKFVDGEAVFDENGKIAKGPSYFAPDLTPYI